MTDHIAEMLDKLCDHARNLGSHAIVPPIGPRTLGCEDSRWTRERDALFDVDRAVEESQLKRVTVADVNGLMIAIAAKADDPTLIFADDKEAVALRWTMGVLKPAFQAMRVPRKKPWPEFLVALMNVSCLTSGDCDILSTLFGVHIGHVREDSGELVVPQCLLDADFTSTVIDARSASDTVLGALVAEAHGRYINRPRAHSHTKVHAHGQSTSTRYSTQTISELRIRANALAVCAKHDSRAVLSSKLASREAALHIHSPTSN
jgi:hypothetical protein